MRVNYLFVFKASYFFQKFKNCLRKLAIVDITLEKLGTTINYQQLHMKVVRIVLVWFAIAMLINYVQILYLKYHFKYNTTTAIYYTFMINYCNHINLIGDLTMTSILGLVLYNIQGVTGIIRQKETINRAR